MTSREASNRHTRGLYLGLFVVLLAGEFTIDRITPALPPLDARWIGLGVLTLVAVGWVGGRVLRSEKTVRRAPGVVLVLAWLGWVVATAGWSADGARTGDRVTDAVVMMGLLALTGLFAARASSEDLSRIWWWIFVTAVLYLVAALIAGPGLQGRYSAFGGGPNVFARVMALGVVAALFLGVRYRRIFLVGAPWFVLGAVLSGSRGGLIALVLGVGVFVFRLLPVLGPRLRWSGVGIAGVAVATAPLYASGFIEVVRQRYVQQTFAGGYDSGRLQLFTDTIGIAVSHPVFGAGLDSYFATIGYQRGFEYPHNLVLEVFADGGVVGVALLTAALVGLVGPVLRSGSWRAPEVLAPLSAAAVIFVASMTSGSYYDSRLLWFFLILAAAQSRDHEAPRRGREERSVAVRWAAATPDTAAGARQRRT
ncbi:O-antigen ligase family protein [Aeromicrobium sp.]|uniref:O-antigen ligase family protein n=1 Tax=Aeromicrobium sp. TaxID=1871063 RepID=UPI0040345DDF